MSSALESLVARTERLLIRSMQEGDISTMATIQQGMLCIISFPRRWKAKAGISRSNMPFGLQNLRQRFSSPDWAR